MTFEKVLKKHKIDLDGIVKVEVNVDDNKIPVEQWEYFKGKKEIMIFLYEDGWLLIQEVKRNEDKSVVEEKEIFQDSIEIE